MYITSVEHQQKQNERPSVAISPSLIAFDKSASANSPVHGIKGAHQSPTTANNASHRYEVRRPSVDPQLMSSAENTLYRQISPPVSRIGRKAPHRMSLQMNTPAGLSVRVAPAPSLRTSVDDRTPTAWGVDTASAPEHEHSQLLLDGNTKRSDQPQSQSREIPPEKNTNEVESSVPKFPDRNLSSSQASTSQRRGDDADIRDTSSIADNINPGKRNSHDGKPQAVRLASAPSPLQFILALEVSKQHKRINEQLECAECLYRHLHGLDAADSFSGDKAVVTIMEKFGVHSDDVAHDLLLTLLDGGVLFCRSNPLLNDFQSFDCSATYSFAPGWPHPRIQKEVLEEDVDKLLSSDDSHKLGRQRSSLPSTTIHEDIGDHSNGLSGSSLDDASSDIDDDAPIPVESPEVRTRKLKGWTMNKILSHAGTLRRFQAWARMHGHTEQAEFWESMRKLRGPHNCFIRVKDFETTSLGLKEYDSLWFAPVCQCEKHTSMVWQVDCIDVIPWSEILQKQYLELDSPFHIVVSEKILRDLRFFTRSALAAFQSMRNATNPTTSQKMDLQNMSSKIYKLCLQVQKDVFIRMKDTLLEPFLTSSIFLNSRAYTEGAPEDDDHDMYLL